MIDPADIRTGLERGEFFLEYLPTISLADGCCLGAEALIRWRRPTGVVFPNDFIPVVEKSLLAGLITYWVMDMVTSEMRAWLETHPEAYIGINAPPEILGRGGMAYVAGKSGLAQQARQIMLEITERGVPDALGLESINQRGGIGARIALDDVTFMGGANLAVLARCHFDAIKLDKSIVDQISSERPSPEWLRLVAALTASSKLLIIAEGVETELQFGVLRGAGVHAAQGFYFSRPIPAAAFMDFYRDRQPAGSRGVQ